MGGLEDERRAARSGKCNSLVILVHGYGADGNDLISIGDTFAEHLPDTSFRAPNAPQPCANNPAGYQWFPIPWLDGSSEVDATVGMLRSVDLLNSYIDTAMSEDAVPASRTVLLGFSQGTMMSLHIAPRRPEPFAGIVGFSGRLLRPGDLARDTISRPPVFLVHGDRDEMVPPASLPEAVNALTEAGFEVTAHVSKGIGHGIAPDALGMALSFIRKQFDANTP